MKFALAVWHGRDMLGNVSEWYEELFDERYLAFYAEAFTRGASADEIEFIDRALGLPSEASILDLGCGFGRHAIPLAERGYRVTGFDRSKQLLDVARKMAGSLGIELRWVEGDLRDLSQIAPVDACVCLYTVFGYFSDDDNARALAQIHRVLQPGGRLLLDVDNPIPLFARMAGDRWWEASSGVRRERHRYDALSGRIVTRRTLFATTGERVELPESSVRLYLPHELRRLLIGAGFELEQVHGGLEGKPIDWASSPMQSWLVRKK